MVMLVGGFPGTWLDDFSMTLGLSSSQLIFIFFGGVETTNQICLKICKKYVYECGYSNAINHPFLMVYPTHLW